MMNSVEHIDDPELIRETLGGSPLAFGKIVRLYQREVRMIISRWVRCPAAADDVAQDTFVAAYENLNRFDDQRSLRSWLIGIAKNKAKLHLRSETRRRNHELVLLQLQIQEWKAQEIELFEDTSDQGSLATCPEKVYSKPCSSLSKAPLLQCLRKVAENTLNKNFYK